MYVNLRRTFVLNLPGTNIAIFIALIFVKKIPPQPTTKNLPSKRATSKTFPENTHNALVSITIISSQHESFSTQPFCISLYKNSWDFFNLRTNAALKHLWCTNS